MSNEHEHKKALRPEEAEHRTGHPRARLDADRTAKPKTEIAAVFPDNGQVLGFNHQIREYVVRPTKEESMRATGEKPDPVEASGCVAGSRSESNPSEGGKAVSTEAHAGSSLGTGHAGALADGACKSLPSVFRTVDQSRHTGFRFDDPRPPEAVTPEEAAADPRRMRVERDHYREQYHEQLRATNRAYHEVLALRGALSEALGAWERLDCEGNDRARRLSLRPMIQGEPPDPRPTHPMTSDAPNSESRPTSAEVTQSLDSGGMNAGPRSTPGVAAGETASSDAELESPPFRPAALDEFEARGFKREQRTTKAVTEESAAAVRVIAEAARERLRATGAAKPGCGATSPSTGLSCMLLAGHEGACFWGALPEERPPKQHRRDVRAVLRAKALAFLNSEDREDEVGHDHVQALVRLLEDVRNEALRTDYPLIDALRWTEWLYVDGYERSCLRCLRKESQGHSATCPLPALLHDPGCDSRDVDPAIGRSTKPCNCQQRSETARQPDIERAVRVLEAARQCQQSLTPDGESHWKRTDPNWNMVREMKSAITTALLLLRSMPTGSTK